MKYCPMAFPSPLDPECRHEPQLAGLRRAQLDEVVPAPERPELPVGDLLRGVLAAKDHLRVTSLEELQERLHLRSGLVELPVPSLVLPEADRHGVLDFGADLRERVREMVCMRTVEAHGGHAAPDVDAHRRRDHCAGRRNHRPDRCTHSPVDVRHHRHVLVDERQRGNVFQLLDRVFLDVYAPRPHLDRRAPLFESHVVFHRESSCSRLCLHRVPLLVSLRRHRSDPDRVSRLPSGPPPTALRAVSAYSARRHDRTIHRRRTSER